jgi:hypothetical protein
LNSIIKKEVCAKCYDLLKAPSKSRRKTSQFGSACAASQKISRSAMARINRPGKKPRVKCTSTTRKVIAQRFNRPQSLNRCRKLNGGQAGWWEFVD